MLRHRRVCPHGCPVGVREQASGFAGACLLSEDSGWNSVRYVHGRTKGVRGSFKREETSAAGKYRVE